MLRLRCDKYLELEFLSVAMNELWLSYHVDNDEWAMSFDSYGRLGTLQRDYKVDL